MRRLRLACCGGLILAAAFLAGCAGPSPNYAPSIDNVEELKKSGASKVGVGAITPVATLTTANAIPLRAARMVSSVGTNYGDYVAAALRQELDIARLLDANSAIQITGTLTRNEINSGNIAGMNSGDIEARFVVRSQGAVRYDKVVAAHHEWPGAFAGAVAIPEAAANYPLLVQKLIGQLVADPQFVQSLKN